MRVVPIYPPTTYMLVAPLTLLSWQWANLVLVFLETLAVCIISLCVVATSRHDLRDEEGWLIVALVLAFASFYTAVHVANILVISTVLCALAVYLASHDSDLRAGILLGVATCLKPHLGILRFAFYLLRRKWQLVVAGSVSGLLLLGDSFARIGLPLNAVLSNYSANLHYWIRPGGQNDFGLANPIRFDLQIFRLFSIRSWAVWIYAVYRNPECSPALAPQSTTQAS
jgi:Glycosyltransferase family 87